MPDPKHIDRQIKELHQAARIYRSKGMDDETMVRELVKLGATEDYARMVVANSSRDEDKRSMFRFTLALGIAITLGGIILNIILFKLAERLHSNYIYIFWGVVVAGLLVVVRAFVVYRS